TKLRFEALGWGCPVGQTVKKPFEVGFVAVTLRATDPTPVAGTPPRPATGRLVELAPGIGPVDRKLPSIVAVPGRESRSRAGVRPVEERAVGRHLERAT